jgi:hypothetical protein
MGGIIANILVPAFFKPFLDAATGIFREYQQGKISMEQMKTQLTVLAMETFAKNEATYADMVVKTYGNFVDLVKTSRAVRAAYVYCVVTQASVLLWYEVGVPLLVWFYPGSHFPSPGDVLLQWGYGLLILLVGGGMIAIKRPQQPSLPPPPPQPPKG